MSTSTGTWENFFESCDIPAEMGKKYASIFVKQRMKPDLLRDLGKDDLRELGIAALGDQLAIIRYVKLCDGSPPEFGTSSPAAPVVAKTKTNRVRSRTYSDEDEPMLLDEPLSKAPDRHDIYHIKMPEGNTMKTRNILEMHSVLRDKGLIKRGVSGVRRAGIELNRLSGKSMAIQKRSPMKPASVVVQDTDITSSTADGIIPRLGTLRSDAISTKTTVVKDASPSPIKGVNARITGRRAEAAQLPALRIQLDLSPVKKSFPHSQRKVVSYKDDGEFLVGDNMEQLQSARWKQKSQRRVPITERIKLFGQRNLSSAVRENSAKTGRNSRRPVITLGGQRIKLGGTGGRKTKRDAKVGSILDRITMK